MTRLIIVCGLSATGKTTLARELSRRLGIFCLHKDSLKESLYSSLKLSTLEDSRMVGYPAVKGILDLAEENLINGIDVILESPFNYPEEGVLFAEWEKKYDLKIFTVVLEVEEDERKRRFEEREKSKQRHRAHWDTDRVRMFGERKSDYSHMPGKKIILTADRPVKDLLDEALKHIE